MNAGRTVAWASKILAGKEENVKALFDACVKVNPSHYTEGSNTGEKTNFYEILNASDLYFELKLKEGNATEQIVLYPQSKQLISAKAGQSSLTYEVTSTYVRSDKHLDVRLQLK